MKKDYRSLGGFLGVIGMLFSKYMYDKYDQDYMVLAMTITLVVIVGGLIVVMCYKQYLAAFIMFILASPVVLIAIGIYSENIYFTGAGVLSECILLPIVLMMMKKKLNR